VTVSPDEKRLTYSSPSEYRTGEHMSSTDTADRPPRRAHLVTVVTAMLLLWAGFAYQVSRPVDADGYRRTITQVVATTHDAASTAALTGHQQLAGQVFAAFATSAYDDAGKALAGAQKKLAGQPPPDDASARLRDRVAALMQATVQAFGDAATARSDEALRAAVAALDHLARNLGALLTQLESA